jgi:NADPH2:quinone reductase
VRAVQITRFGGPEVLQVVDVEPPAVRGDLVLVDVHSAGVNYADTHQIENSYLAPQKLPLVPGAEVVGTARTGPLAGRRVVALTLSGGGYADQAVAHPSAVFPLPDDVPDAVGLALILQGTTAWHLLRTCGRIVLGESVVVHAAAGGVGTLAVQLAKQWGAGRVIATASSPQKRELALGLGADAAVDVSRTSTADEVRDVLRAANGGRDVDIVLEMTGGHVTDGSLAALGPWGRLVVYGMASRTTPSPVGLGSLMAHTRSVIGFWLVHALQLPGGLGPAMEELLSLVRAGRLKPVVGRSYPLADAARAHQDLLSRTTTGKLTLTLG